jgi:hypothetical protein
MLSLATTANIGACGTIGMMLYMKILWNSGVSKPHSNSCQNYYICMHVTNTITIMSKHTHDIIILALLSTHAPPICKHDPTPNPSFPIY